jgi:hypothetical protein
MRKIVIVLSLSFLVLSCDNIWSQNIFNEFKEKFENQYVAPFNKDLTGIVCSNVLNTAGSLGLFTAVPPSIGLNIKLNFVSKKISEDNTILNEAFKDVAVKMIPFAALQIEKGLPFNLDVILRYSGYDNFMFYGFGIKYKVLSLPPVVPIVNIAVAGFYNILEAKDILKHTSESINLIVSVDKIPVVRPYIVVGMDTSELAVDKKITIIDEIKNKMDFKTRYELGINFSFIPFFYFNLGYGSVYNTEEYILNLGLKF